MSDREKARREAQRRGSFTLREWCDHRRKSMAMFYKIAGQGLAPKTYYVGSRQFVSEEADQAWAREREAENQTAA
jgi:hypothetical protein